MSKTKISMQEEEPRWFRYGKGILSGTVAGITITLIGHPFDTLKVRLQVQSETKKVYNGLMDCFIKTMKWEGPSGLYKGVASPLAGQLFMRTALFTSFYEAVEFSKQYKDESFYKGQYLFAGAVAGFCSAFVDGPLDLFKSKLQIQILNQKSGKTLEHPYRSVFHCGASIFRNYGIRGVFQGLGPTLARNTMGYSIYFATFEYLKSLFLKEGQSKSELEASNVIMSGALAGIVFWTSIYNFDVVKSAMMADNINRKERLYSSMLNCFIKLYKNEGGYARLWRGFSPCLLRSAPGNGAMLYVVDITRNFLPTYDSIFS